MGYPKYASYAWCIWCDLTDVLWLDSYIHVCLCYCFTYFRYYFLCAATIMWRKKPSFTVVTLRQTGHRILDLLNVSQSLCRFRFRGTVVIFPKRDKAGDVGANREIAARLTSWFALLLRTTPHNSRMCAETKRLAE